MRVALRLGVPLSLTRTVTGLSVDPLTVPGRRAPNPAPCG